MAVSICVVSGSEDATALCTPSFVACTNESNMAGMANRVESCTNGQRPCVVKQAATSFAGRSTTVVAALNARLHALRFDSQTGNTLLLNAEGRSSSLGRLMVPAYIDPEQMAAKGYRVARNATQLKITFGGTMEWRRMAAQTVQYTCMRRWKGVSHSGRSVRQHAACGHADKGMQVTGWC